MRHANAGPTTDAKDDDERPLDAEGIKEAQAAGIALKLLKTPIQACLYSPLTRAQMTAEIVCEELGVDMYKTPELCGHPLSVATLKLLCKPHGNCLLVGHAPSVSLLVHDLTGAQVQLAKGGLAQVHEGEVWTLLNPSTTMVMADMVDFDDPQEVDHRSEDDCRQVQERVVADWLHRPAAPSWAL